MTRERRGIRPIMPNFQASPDGTATPRPTAGRQATAPQLSWQPSDYHPLITAAGLLGLTVAVAMALWGLPPVDLHGPLHRIGVMDPLCGGTRAAYFTMRGDLTQAWVYNPLGIVAVLAAVTAASRILVRVVTGRWLTVTYAWTPRRRRIVFAVAVALLVVLEIRQQLRADLLVAGI